MQLSIEGSHAAEAAPPVGVPRRSLVELVRAQGIALVVEACNISTEHTCAEYSIEPAGNRGDVVVQGDSDSIGCRNLVGGALKAEKVTNRLKAFTLCLLTAM